MMGMEDDYFSKMFLFEMLPCFQGRHSFIFSKVFVQFRGGGFKHTFMFAPGKSQPIFDEHFVNWVETTTLRFPETVCSLQLGCQMR